MRVEFPCPYCFREDPEDPTFVGGANTGAAWANLGRHVKAKHPDAWRAARVAGLFD